MQKTIFIFVLCIVSIFCISCDRNAKEIPSLHVFTWSDYMDPEVIQQFETEYNCKVVIDSFESNEAMYAKIKAGAVGYDVLVPSSYMAEYLYKQKMIQPLKHELLPNLSNLNQELLKLVTNDKTSSYSVPYMLTLTGIGYNTKKVQNFEPTWGVLDRQDLKGKMTLLNDMRETLGAALKYLGYSINTLNEKELEKARDVVIRWKKNVAKFGVEDAKMGLGSDEFTVAHQYSGDVYQVIKEKPEIEFCLPKEGFCVSSDDMVIPTQAKQVELAHKFINFLLDAKVSAKNMEFLYYIAPNTKAQEFLSEEFKAYVSKYLDPKLLSRSEVIQDLGDDIKKYIDVWNQVKASEE